ncbi:MAG: hypothetical protein ACREOO_19990 [bacterium]
MISEPESAWREPNHVSSFVIFVFKTITQEEIMAKYFRSIPAGSLPE